MTSVAFFFNRSRIRIGRSYPAGSSQHLLNTFHEMINRTSASSFGGKLCFHLFIFHDFCQQQTHTPARASTRHPAKHESKGLTWGFDTAEHRLHCYVDHNYGFAAVVTSLYEAKHQDAATLDNLCATVSFHEVSRTFPMRLHRDTFDTLWASGHAKTCTCRFTPSELPHCSIALGGLFNSGTAPVDDVYRY